MNAECVCVCVLCVTCAVTLLSGPQYSAGLLVFSLAVPVIGEGVYALVTAGVCVGVSVIDHHIVRWNRKMNPQLVAGEAALGLDTGRQNKRAMKSNFEFYGILSKPVSHLFVSLVLKRYNR